MYNTLNLISTLASCISGMRSILGVPSDVICFGSYVSETSTF